MRLEDILNYNQWWSKGSTFALYDKDLSFLKNPEIPFVFERTTPELSKGKIYIIRGPRRIGKTVMLKTIVYKLLEKNTAPRNIFYVSLETVARASEFENLLNEYLSYPTIGMRYMLLDEIQNVTGWRKIIQGMVDSGRMENIAVVITGSIAHMLEEEIVGRGIEGNTYIMRQINFREFCLTLLNDINKEFGVNRINKILGYNFTNEEAEKMRNAIISMPITLEEDLKHINEIANKISVFAIPLKKMFLIYLRTGGYPMSINSYLNSILSYGSKNVNNFKIDPEIYEKLYNYAKNDAAMLTSERSGDPAKAGIVINEMLNYIGKKISYSKIARAANMNATTLNFYIKRFENSYAFSSIKGIDSDMKYKTFQKIYFSDIFLHYSAGSAASGMNPDEYTENLLLSDAIGTIAEEIVISHLIGIKENYPMKQYNTYINFLVGRNNKEIDFVFKRNDMTYFGIEVKYQNTIDSREIYKTKKIKDYLILTKDTMQKIDNTLALPIYLALVLFSKSEHSL